MIQMSFKKLIIPFIALVSLMLVFSSCTRQSARSQAEPRSALGDREVGKDFYKAPKLGKKKKVRKGKEIRPTNAYVEASKRRYKKQEKYKDKPQYTDPSYFGHKKPPKKRKRGKRKLCKECGMVH